MNRLIRIHQPTGLNISQSSLQRLQALFKLLCRRVGCTPPLKEIFKRNIGSSTLGLLQDVLTKRFDLFNDCTHGCDSITGENKGQFLSRGITLRGVEAAGML